MRTALDTAGVPTAVVSAINAFRAKLDSIGGGSGGRRGGGGAAPTFRALNGTFAGQLNAQDNADHAPNAPMRAAYLAACKELAKVQGALAAAIARDLPALNAALAANNRTAIAVPAAPTVIVCR